MKSTNTITANTQDKLVSLKVVAAMLGLSTRAVYRLIASDTIPKPVKIGGATRFFVSDIYAYMDWLKDSRE